MWLSSLFLFTFLLWAPVTTAQQSCDVAGNALLDNSVDCNWNINMNFQDIIDNNPDLVFLRITDYGGSGSPNLGTIPDSIETLTKLQYLQVGSVSLLAGSVPASIARLPNLSSLSLDDLDLDGTFPEEIFQMESLDTLYLHELGDRLDPLDLPALGIPSIKSITIVNIPTTRNFPIEWVNSVSEIEELRLCNLKLDGEISEIRPDRLTSLHLINNQLSGELPRIAKNVPWLKLETLRLEGNNFVGSIPAEYEDYIRDHSFTLSVIPNTQLSGVVPTGSKICGFAPAHRDPTELWVCSLIAIGENNVTLPVGVRGQSCNEDANCLGLESMVFAYFSKCMSGYCCHKGIVENCVRCEEGSGHCTKQSGLSRQEYDNRMYRILAPILVGSGILLSGLVAYKFRKNKEHVESEQDHLQVGVAVPSEDLPVAEIYT